MKQILNTLYVTLERSYVHLDHDTVKVDLQGTTQLQVPLLHLGGIFCFGDVSVSPALIRRSAEDGRALVFFDRNGEFKARLEGPLSGNVLLRQAQHFGARAAEVTVPVARNIVAAKLQNSRQVVLRAAREASRPEDAAPLESVGREHAAALSRLERASDLDHIRGIEGEAARAYFAAFGCMVRESRDVFSPNGRTRRPPLDRMNALLSFLYALLLSDCVAAAEGVGLDPQVGFLHALRPGRPALGLDLMEELRAVLADRLALTLVNRRQITPNDFEVKPGGAVYLAAEGRKTVVVAYQKRKQDEVQHPALTENLSFGLVPHVQARLLARYLRKDVKEYAPFLYH